MAAHSISSWIHLAIMVTSGSRVHDFAPKFVEPAEQNVINMIMIIAGNALLPAVTVNRNA